MGLTTLVSPALARAESWTMLIYWAVDNDLHQASIPYLRALEKTGSSDRLNIIAQVDYPGRTRKTERIQIFREGTIPADPRNDVPHSRVLEEFDTETNSASPEVLTDFLLWGLKKFPADHYIVVIGSHGMNWRGIIEDHTSKSIMPLMDMGRSLEAMNQKRGKPIELLIMDACRMSFADTLFDLSGQAAWLIGSQFDVNGFDHGTPIAELAANPSMTTRELGLSYIRAYPHPDHAEPGISSSLLHLGPRPVTQWSRDFGEITAHLSGLRPEQKAALKDLLEITRNDYRDKAIDFGNLLEALQAVAAPLPARIRDLTDRYLGFTTEVDARDGTTMLSRYPARSVIQGSSFTAQSKRATGLALNCPSNKRDYRSTAFALVHAEWLDLCRELGF